MLRSPLFLSFLTGLFSAIIIASNFMAIKLIDIGCFTLPSAVFCYPFGFVCGDIITELFGFKTARKVVLLVFVFNAIIVCFLTLSVFIPPSLNYTGNEAYKTVFLSAPHILAASFTAFIISGILNSFIFDKLKKTGKIPLMARSSISTAMGAVLDSFVFIGIAFTGKLPLPVLFMTILGQIIAKNVVGVIIGTPLTWCILRWLKKGCGASPSEYAIMASLK